ncbi:MAG: hydantoinase/oxoprolinase family protein [Pseudomonadota bacterium]
MVQRAIRLSADIGGTFTDVVLEIENTQYSTKILTTHTAPEEAILDGLNNVCSQAGISPDRIDQVIHGTTLATNALIERRGAKTALITTKGFRDVIEMRTESRFEQYDLNLIMPEPLLPRYQRYTVDERIAADGQILLPLNENQVEECALKLRDANYESVAVGFIHSYANNEHEQRTLAVLKRILPEIAISLSSEVSPQMREYERFNTVIANAYIKPMMKDYLYRLRDRLKIIGVACPVFLMHSGGGVISLENAAEFPVRLVESGPAGGAVFAAHIAARHGLSKTLSFDMGGTTAKICLIKNQAPKTTRVFEVARAYRFKKGSGMPISIPVIDMVEIGAGGGSVAHLDAMRQIRVGPASTGSEPGPACYARGGEQAAVTDADLVLGRLDPDHFAGGAIILDQDRACKALYRSIGASLDINAEAVAFGVSEVVDESMANAARVHAVENGEDLTGYAMIAFGGAAPLHAGRLCEKLGVERCLVPPAAGVGSAVGFLRAPFSFEATRSQFMRLSEFCDATARRVLQELDDEARQFVTACNVSEEITSEYQIYMRYAGQGFEIPVPLPLEFFSNPSKDKIISYFEKEYQMLFGRTVRGIDMEITVWAVHAKTLTPPVERVEGALPAVSANGAVKRKMYDASADAFIDASAYRREALSIGASVSGLCAIVETDTTIIVPAGFYAFKTVDGCIDIRRGG